MTVVAVLVELFLQGLHLLLQQHHLVLHLSDQRVSLRKLLLQQALFLSQVNHFFFGCHIPTVFGSGLVGKPLVLVNSYIEFKSLTENIDTSTPTGVLMFHFIGALAEFERNLIRERTNAGLEAARARGHFGGRPKKGETETKRMARQLYADKSNSIKDICKSLRISKATLYRYVHANRPVKKKIEGKDLVVEVLPE